MKNKYDDIIKKCAYFHNLCDALHKKTLFPFSKMSFIETICKKNLLLLFKTLTKQQNEYFLTKNMVT